MQRNKQPSQGAAVQRTRHGRTLNPELLEDHPGVAFLNSLPSARQRRAGVKVSKHPCPYRRQHAVSRDAAAIEKLNRLFARQRAQLKRDTGLPYFVDAEQDRESARLLRYGIAQGLVQL